MQIAPKNVFRYPATVPSGMRGSARSCTRSSAGERPPSSGDDYSFAMDVRGRHHRGLLRHRRQDHEACVTPRSNDRLRAYVRQLPSPTRSTGTSGSSAVANRAQPEGDGAGERASSTRSSSPATCSSYFDGAAANSGAALRRLLRRRLRHRSCGGLKTAQAMRRTRPKRVKGYPVGPRVVRRLRLQLLERGVGARARAERPRAATGAKLQASLPRTLGGVLGSAKGRVINSTAGGRRSRTSTSCRSAKGGRNLSRHDRGLRAERGSDVRRRVRTEQAGARPGLPTLREEVAPVAGEDQGGQERRHHQPGHQVGR